MKNLTRRPACPSLLAAGAALALAAAPQAASAQAVGSLRSGAIAAQPGTAAGQPVPRPVQMRPGPFFGRPATGGTFQTQEPTMPGLPYRRIQNGGGAPGEPTIVVTRQFQSGYSSTPGWQQTEPNGGAGNVFSNQYYSSQYGSGNGNTYSGTWPPPIGPANGFIPNPLPPVGPANGFGPGSFSNRPTGGRGPQNSYGNGYVYGAGVAAPPFGGIVAPPLLGGYYYGNYCDTASGASSYPSVYSTYSGLPGYIFSPGVVVVAQPDAPDDAAPPESFSPPTYQVTYNNNYYYVASEDRAQQLQGGGDSAREALKNAYPADSYQAAFGDVARAWLGGDVKTLRRHVRDSDTRISVSLNGKYSYSIASSDFVQITRDALDRLHTVSFEFTHVRKAKNGDVTAYGKHVYRASDPSSQSGAADGDVVPFDQSGGDVPPAPSASATGDEKTVYVSYTLRRQDGRWNVIALDSSDHSLVPPSDR